MTIPTIENFNETELTSPVSPVVEQTGSMEQRTVGIISLEQAPSSDKIRVNTTSFNQAVDEYKQLAHEARKNVSSTKRNIAIKIVASLTIAAAGAAFTALTFGWGLLGLIPTMPIWMKAIAGFIAFNATITLPAMLMTIGSGKDFSPFPQLTRYKEEAKHTQEIASNMEDVRKNLTKPSFQAFLGERHEGQMDIDAQTLIEENKAYIIATAPQDGQMLQTIATE